MLFALQFDPLVMVERFGVCLGVMVLAVINSRYVLPSADCFGCLYNFKVGQVIYLRVRELHVMLHLL